MMNPHLNELAAELVLSAIKEEPTKDQSPENQQQHFKVSHQTALNRPLRREANRSDNGFDLDARKAGKKLIQREEALQRVFWHRERLNLA